MSETTAQDRPRRPMRADARRNYDRLVEVATASFLEHGPSASLDEIAKRAGVGPGTLYRHFPTRDDLLEAVCRQWMDSVLADAEPLFTAQEPTLALWDWLVRLVSHLTTFRGLAAALLLSPESKHSTGGVLYLATERLLRRAQEAGGVRQDVTVMEVTQLVSGVTYACSSARELGKPNDPERLIDLIMDGLRARR